MTAVEDLARWLAIYHPRYTVADIVPSPVKGYLHTTKACSCTRPPFDGYRRRQQWTSTNAHPYPRHLGLSQGVWTGDICVVVCTGP